MPLSWNEIRHRAIAFANEWKGEARESAERQTGSSSLPSSRIWPDKGVARRTGRSWEAAGAAWSSSKSAITERRRYLASV